MSQLARTNLFEYGRLYAEELQRLIDGHSINPQEAAAIIAQTDGLSDLASQALSGSCRPDLLDMLVRVGSHDRLQCMLSLGVSPSVVRAVRRRRHATFCRLWGCAQSDFLADSAYLCEQCVASREWPMYMHEQRRRIVARCLFALLYWGGLRYRMGFRPDLTGLRVRIGALLLDLPHHSVA